MRRVALLLALLLAVTLPAAAGSAVGPDPFIPHAIRAEMALYPDDAVRAWTDCARTPEGGCVAVTLIGFPHFLYYAIPLQGATIEPQFRECGGVSPVATRCTVQATLGGSERAAAIIRMHAGFEGVVDNEGSTTNLGYRLSCGFPPTPGAAPCFFERGPFETVPAGSVLTVEGRARVYAANQWFNPAHVSVGQWSAGVAI